MSNIKLEYIYL